MTQFNGEASHESSPQLGRGDELDVVVDGFDVDVDVDGEVTTVDTVGDDDDEDDDDVGTTPVNVEPKDGLAVTVVIEGVGAAELATVDEAREASPASMNSCSVRAMGVFDPSHALFLISAVWVNWSTGQFRATHAATASSQLVFLQRQALVRLQPDAAKFS